MSNFNSKKHIHFIGIGGISMSALSKLMLLMGNTVSGSDAQFSDEIITLTEWGVNAYVGHNVDIVKKADLVVYSYAIKDDDIELNYAKSLLIATVARPYFLAEVAKKYSKVIAISGTHGKTTTTGFLTYVMMFAQREFTTHIGGNISNMGNLIYRGMDYFITEACEYQKGLQAITSDIAVVLNAEFDHPDTYRDLKDVYETFDIFVSNAVKRGVAVMPADIDYQPHISDDEHIYKYSLDSQKGIGYTNVQEYKSGFYSYQIVIDGIPKCDIVLNIPGFHNVSNSMAVVVVARILGIELPIIKLGLEAFPGVERRYQYKGICNNAKVYIDYAHHPREILTATKTAFSQKTNRLLVVFQPHTYSRTARLYDEFIKCFCLADKLYLFRTYPARELPTDGKSALELYKDCKKDYKECYYYESTMELAKTLIKTAEEGDIILILGAGDIDSLSDLVVDKKYI